MFKYVGKLLKLSYFWLCFSDFLFYFEVVACVAVHFLLLDDFPSCFSCCPHLYSISLFSLSLLSVSSAFSLYSPHLCCSTCVAPPVLLHLCYSTCVAPPVSTCTSSPPQLCLVFVSSSCALLCVFLLLCSSCFYLVVLRSSSLVLCVLVFALLGFQNYNITFSIKKETVKVFLWVKMIRISKTKWNFMIIPILIFYVILNFIFM